MSEQLALEFAPAPTAAGLADVLRNPAVRYALEAIELAEAAIAAAQRAHASKAELLDRAFVALRPRPAVFGDLTPQLLRPHMDELLERVARDAAELAPGTAAEVCLVMMRLSLAAPLRQAWATAYMVAFVDVFGRDRTAELITADATDRAIRDRDSYSVAEVLREVRHQMRDDDRGRAWREASKRAAAA